MRQLAVRIDDQLLDLIDKRAEGTNSTRIEIIRSALIYYLVKASELDLESILETIIIRKDKALAKSLSKTKKDLKKGRFVSHDKVFEK